jgi:hypothetical protein
MLLVQSEEKKGLAGEEKKFKWNGQLFGKPISLENTT